MKAPRCSVKFTFIEELLLLHKRAKLTEPSMKCILSILSLASDLRSTIVDLLTSFCRFYDNYYVWSDTHPWTDLV